MITLDHVSFASDSSGAKVTILHDIAVRTDATRLAIIGPNGSGKSTLLKLISGELRPTTGIVRVGVDAELSRSFLAYIPQHASDGLWLDLTVHETLRLAVNRDRMWPYVAETSALEECIGWLPRVLKGRLDARVRTLSGGERQMLQLAAALGLARSTNPGTQFAGIAADEFTAALDVRHVQQVRDSVSEMLTTVLNNRLFVFVTHSHAEMRAFASDVIALRAGRLAWHRPVDAIEAADFQRLYDE